MAGDLDKALARGTVVTQKEHAEALRAADQRALTIKETADELARQLDRKDREYKDEKANNLREQISSERNLYPTKAQLYSYLLGAAATGAAIVAVVRR